MPRRSSVSKYRAGTTRRAGAPVLVAIVALLALAAFPMAASAGTVAVHPHDMGIWTTHSEGSAGTSGEFVNGPGTPPMGTGSFRETIGTLNSSTDRTWIETSAYGGTPLGNLGGLSYSTYITANQGSQSIFLVLILDLDGNGTYEAGIDDMLAFEPTYQTGTYGGDPVPPQCGSPCLALGTWQAWDAGQGGWWSAKDGNSGPPLVTLSNYLTLHPGARLATGVPSVRLQAGSGQSWSGFDGNVDGFTVGSTTYDFDSLIMPVDCDAASDDISAVQDAVDQAPDGWTIQIAGTCDFTGAGAHGGDTVSIESAAVLIRQGTPVNGLTIESAGAPQSATIVGSGVEAAFFVAPSASNVTIRGLKFVNLGRAVVVLDAANATIGAEGATVPNPAANRIIGNAGTSSAILALASDRGYQDNAGTATVRFGAGGSHEATLSTEGRTLTGLKVLGNYISYDPPGPPDGSTRDVVAIDVRQNRGGTGSGIEIRNNAVGMFSSEFPSFNMNGVRVEAHASNLPYHLTNVVVESNNLGRLEEVDQSGVNAGDIHAAGRAGIVLDRVSDFKVNGNGVRARLSPTGLPMPGGGIVVGDSSDGEISGNGIIVLADASTQSADLGAIGVVDDMMTLFGGSPDPHETRGILVSGNTVGMVGADPPGVGAQRGIVLNGADHASVIGNTIKYTSGPAVSIGVEAQGPGNLDQPGIRSLKKAVTESVVCGNILDGASDNAAEITFDATSGSTANAFPSGEAWTGNMACAPAVALSSSSLQSGDPLTVTGTGWAARSARVTLSGAGAPPVTHVASTSGAGAFSTVFSATEAGDFSAGALVVTAISRDDLSGATSPPSAVSLTKGTPPSMTYDEAVAEHKPYRDMAKQGDASATSAANRLGVFSAETSASDSLPVGVSVGGLPVGQSSAYANGRARHHLAVASGGTYVVTATFAGVSASATAEGTTLDSLSYAASLTYASVQGTYACGAGCGGGQPPIAQAALRQLACDPVGSTCSPSDAFQLTLTFQIPSGQTGSILIDAGLYASSVVSGNGSANASISGRLANLSLAKV